MRKRQGRSLRNHQKKNRLQPLSWMAEFKAPSGYMCNELKYKLLGRDLFKREKKRKESHLVFMSSVFYNCVQCIRVYGGDIFTLLFKFGTSFGSFPKDFTVFYFTICKYGLHCLPPLDLMFLEKL